MTKPTEIVLSDDQAKALEQILDWLYDSDEQTLSVGGYAGTGKSTIVSYLVDLIGPDDVAVCAFTGKAASVLQSKDVDASTMHRLIYEPKLRCSLCDCAAHIEACPRCHTRTYLELVFKRVPELICNLVIVDEASMLSTRLVDDLLSYKRRVLFVGDHGQLEPVGDDPGVMKDPDIRLEVIHRQAKGSAIIQFAHWLREGNDPLGWQGGAEVTIRRGINGIDFSGYDVVICGFNRTRVAVNNKIRKSLGHSGAPCPGERLICLRNDYEIGVFNGMLVTVLEVRSATDERIVLDFVSDGGQSYVQVPIDRSYLGSPKKPKWGRPGLGQFDFGYCLTAHKFQGSEAERVAVLEQLCDLWSPERWRYTAATRASEELHYFLSEKNGARP